MSKPRTAALHEIGLRRLSAWMGEAPDPAAGVGAVSLVAAAAELMEAL